MIGQPPARIGNHVEIRFESGGEQFAVTFDVPRMSTPRAVPMPRDRRLVPGDAPPRAPRSRADLAAVAAGMERVAEIS